MSVGNVAVAMRDLTLGYQRHPAVHHVDCEIALGSLTALIGPNGAGKTTFLRGLAKELKPLGGSIFKKRSLKTVLLPQSHNIDFSVPITVEEAVAMGMWNQVGLLGAIGRNGRERIAAALEAVGLKSGDRRLLGELSCGVLQRVLFARLILRDADLILLDEPFQCIDSITVEDLLVVIDRWHEQGKTVIVSLHDLEITRSRFPRTIMLARELLEHGSSGETATPENLDRARQLCVRFDEHSKECKRQMRIGKAMPNGHGNFLNSPQ